jgi:hypothetical protein
MHLHPTVALISVLVVAGCSSATSMPPPDSPAAQATLPRFPGYDDPIWVRKQGIPLKRAWLREGRTTIDGGEMFVLPNVLSRLPYKNVQETKAWVSRVNATYRPRRRWHYNPKRRMGHYKCMSVSASTILDWYALREGRTLPRYRSWLNGHLETGYDSRVFDAVYFQRARSDSRFRLLAIYRDPVERTKIPYNMEAFARIITEPGRSNSPAGEFKAPDPVLRGVVHRLRFSALPKLRYHVLFKYLPMKTVAAAPKFYNKLLVDALERNGPVFAGLRLRYGSSGGVIAKQLVRRLAGSKLSGHGVVLVGYIRQAGRVYFIYREVFGKFDKGWTGGGPAYRLYPVHAIYEAYSFYPTKR